MKSISADVSVRITEDNHNEIILYVCIYSMGHTHLILTAKF